MEIDWDLEGYKARMASRHPKSQFTSSAYSILLRSSRYDWVEPIFPAFKNPGGPRLGVSPKLYMHRIASSLVYFCIDGVDSIY